MSVALPTLMLLAACGGIGNVGVIDGTTGTGSLVSSPDQVAKILAASSRADAVAATPLGYYVDSNLGSDDADGSAAHPWKSLARLRTVTLRSGEGFYLRCGRVWRESLSLSAAQLADASVLAGYGPECGTSAATVSGADAFTGGWSQSGGVWSRALPAGTPKITQLFFDGRQMRTARWPNVAAWAVIATGSVPGQSQHTTVGVQVSQQSQLAGREIVGATIHVRTQPWMIESRTVQAYSAGTLRLDQSVNWSIETGEGFVLEDKRWMLDEPGEFFHDTAAQRLYLVAPEGGPADINEATIEGSVRDVAVRIEGRSGLTVRHLAGHRARDAGILVTNASGVALQRVEAGENGASGIRASHPRAGPWNGPGFSVTDSTFTGNARFGIEALDLRGAQVQRNTVLATGTGNDRTTNVISAIAGGPGARIEHNTVDGAGYFGINFSAAGGSVVHGNLVTGFCARLSDCGGIYTYTGRPHIDPTQSSTVSANQVIRAATPERASLATRQSEVVAGIYIDDFTTGVTITENVIAQVPVGIFVHNASGVTARANKLWLVSETGLWASLDQTDADWMRANRFEGNEIVPLVSAVTQGSTLARFNAAQPIRFWHAIDGAVALGPGRNHFIGNRVVELQGPLAVHAWVHGGAWGGFIDIDRWRQLNPEEPASTRPMRFAAASPLLGDELVTDAGFDGGLQHWQSWRSPAGVAFAASAGAPETGCVTGCISLTAGTPGDLIASRPFVLREGATYQYRVVLSTGRGAVTLGSPYVSRETTPWDAMAVGGSHETYLSRRALAESQLDFESYFVAKESALARVNLQLDTVAVRVGVDRVSIREVTGWQAVETAEWAAVAIATPDGSPREIRCADLGWPADCTVADLAGQPVALPLVLGAGDRPRALLRADSPLRR